MSDAPRRETAIPCPKCRGARKVLAVAMPPTYYQCSLCRGAGAVRTVLADGWRREHERPDEDVAAILTEVPEPGFRQVG